MKKQPAKKIKELTFRELRAKHNHERVGLYTRMSKNIENKEVLVKLDSSYCGKILKGTLKVFREISPHLFIYECEDVLFLASDVNFVIDIEKMEEYKDCTFYKAFYQCDTKWKNNKIANDMNEKVEGYGSHIKYTNPDDIISCIKKREVKSCEECSRFDYCYGRTEHPWQDKEIDTFLNCK